MPQALLPSLLRITGSKGTAQARPDIMVNSLDWVWKYLRVVPMINNIEASVIPLALEAHWVGGM
jgi:hypothetical protein